MLAGLAVLLQAALPTGFMPNTGKQAGSFVTICSGVGEKTVFVADEGGDHEQGAGDTCSFAFTLPGLESAPTLRPVMLGSMIDYPAHILVQTFLANTSLDRSHPPTGPPVLL